MLSVPIELKRSQAIFMFENSSFPPWICNVGVLRFGRISFIDSISAYNETNVPYHSIHLKGIKSSLIDFKASSSFGFLKGNFGCTLQNMFLSSKSFLWSWNVGEAIQILLKRSGFSLDNLITGKQLFWIPITNFGRLVFFKTYFYT